MLTDSRRHTKTFDAKTSKQFKPVNPIAVKINKEQPVTFYSSRLEFSLRGTDRETKPQGDPNLELERATLRNTQNIILKKLNNELSKIINPSCNSAKPKENPFKINYMAVEPGTIYNSEPQSIFTKIKTSKGIYSTLKSENESTFLQSISVDREREKTEELNKTASISARGVKFYLPDDAIRGSPHRFYTLKTGYSEVSMSPTPIKSLKTETVAAYGTNTSVRRRVLLDDHN